jgi:group I intron endonuclease
MRAAVVYLVTNTENGKRYVGLTRYTTAKRWGEHKAGASASRTKSALYAAIRKYGPDSFELTEFASCLSLEDATKVEKQAIQQERPEYNLTNGGEFTLGKRELSPEAKERMRLVHAGKEITADQRERISATLKQRYKDDPEFRASSLAALAKGRANCDQSKRIAAVKRAGADGKMSRPMTPERLARQIAALGTAKARGKMAASKRKPVECVTLATVFDSVSEAAEFTGLSISAVSSVCRGRYASANGLVFTF